ncbi:MAG TPA: hypothetical protein VGE52_09865 [Pirellulales bacterium]
MTTGLKELQDAFRDAAERAPHLWAAAAVRLDPTALRAYPDFREWQELLGLPQAGTPAAADDRIVIGIPEPFAACWVWADERAWQCGFYNGEPLYAPPNLGRRARLNWEITARKERYDGLHAAREEWLALAARAAKLLGLPVAKPPGWPAKLPWHADDAAALAWLTELVESRAPARQIGFEIVRFDNIFTASAALLEESDPLFDPESPDESEDAPAEREKPALDWRQQPMPAWLLQAMVLLHDHPELTDEQVAKRVKTPLETLTEDARYREVAARSRQAPEPSPVAHEPQPGEPIPGSQFFVEVCSICGERIRVPRSQVGTQPICRNCAE